MASTPKLMAREEEGITVSRRNSTHYDTHKKSKKKKNNQVIKYLTENDSQMTTVLQLVNKVFKITMFIILKPLMVKRTTFP